MQGGILSTARATHAGLLLGLFATALCSSAALLLGLRELGLVPDPEDLDAQKVVRELGIRLELSFFLAATCVACLMSRGLRSWTRERRWRTLALGLFGAGALCALADPFHPITAEGNWIRYWTAGCLLLAGALALLHGIRVPAPTFDRVVGVGFGLLLVAAGADELLQLHEQLGAALAHHSPVQGILHANDLPTLLVGVAGLFVLAGLVAARSLGGRVGLLLRRRRYRLPLRLFAFAVVAFLIATLLDSFDRHLQHVVELLAAQLLAGDDRLWIALLDFAELANAIEELLEYVAAIALLMMIGNLFSIEQLGAARRDPSP